MNTLLWILQALVAAVFLYSGISKSTLSERALVAAGQTGVEGLPLPLIRFIGISELLGVIGILIPWYLRVLPILTPIAAIGFALIMLLAAPIHYRRREIGSMMGNILLLLLCMFIAYGRLTLELTNVTAGR